MFIWQPLLCLQELGAGKDYGALDTHSEYPIQKMALLILLRILAFKLLRHNRFFFVSYKLPSLISQINTYHLYLKRYFLIGQ